MLQGLVPELTPRNETLLLLADTAEDLRRCIEIIKKRKSKDLEYATQFHAACSTFRLLSHLIIKNLPR